jgi:molecular chaperone HtpG
MAATHFEFEYEIKASPKVIYPYLSTASGLQQWFADKVTVISKSPEEDKQYRWESTAGGTFSVCEDDGPALGRGSKIVLSVKSDNVELLEERKLKDLVKKHSEFIGFPIYLQVEKTTEKEISDDEDEEEKKDDVEIKEDEKKDKKKKKIKEVSTEL